MKNMPKYLKLIFIFVLVLSFISFGIKWYPHPEAQAAPNYSDGTLIKVTNDPNIYIINNNVKVWVRSVEVFDNCGYNWNNLTTVASLDAVSTADLIKKADNPDVYRLEKNFKRKLAAIEIFNSYNLDWNKIATVCSYVFNSYNLAPLIRGQNSADIYNATISDGKLMRYRFTSMAAFTKFGMQTRDIITVNQLELDSYTEGPVFSEIGVSTITLTYPSDEAINIKIPAPVETKKVEIDWTYNYEIGDINKDYVLITLQKNGVLVGSILSGNDYAGTLAYGKYFWDFPKYLASSRYWDASSYIAAPIGDDYKLKIELYRWDDNKFSKVAEDESDYQFWITGESGLSKEVCADYDGGKNYYLKGYITGIFDAMKGVDWGTTANDFCLGYGTPNTLVEYYCNSNGYINSTHYDCPNGCRDGACI